MATSGRLCRLARRPPVRSEGQLPSDRSTRASKAPPSRCSTRSCRPVLFVCNSRSYLLARLARPAHFSRKSQLALPHHLHQAPRLNPLTNNASFDRGNSLPQTNSLCAHNSQQPALYRHLHPPVQLAPPECFHRTAQLAQTHRLLRQPQLATRPIHRATTRSRTPPPSIFPTTIF